jgi:hypothetical protein
MYRPDGGMNFSAPSEVRPRLSIFRNIELTNAYIPWSCWSLYSPSSVEFRLACSTCCTYRSRLQFISWGSSTGSSLASSTCLWGMTYCNTIPVCEGSTKIPSSGDPPQEKLCYFGASQYVSRVYRRVRSLENCINMIRLPAHFFGPVNIYNMTLSHSGDRSGILYWGDERWRMNTGITAGVLPISATSLPECALELSLIGNTGAYNRASPGTQ